MSELFTGAFFYAMCSCEYLKVTGPRKTKILCLRNIRFFKGTQLVQHSNQNLHLADTVSITFEAQKRDTKNDTITQHHTSDPILCLIKTWAKIIKCILRYPSTLSITAVNTFLSPNGKLIQFTGQQLLKRLCLAAEAIGPDTLGFTLVQLGLHSTRSGQLWPCTYQGYLFSQL